MENLVSLSLSLSDAISMWHALFCLNSISRCVFFFAIHFHLIAEKKCALKCIWFVFIFWYFSCTHRVSLLLDFAYAICTLKFEHKYGETRHCTVHSTLDLWSSWCSTMHKRNPTALVVYILCMRSMVSVAPKYCTVSMLWWN